MNAHEHDVPHNKSGGLPPIRIAVVQGNEPEDWRRIYNRLDRSSGMEILLKGSAALFTFFGIFSVAGVLAAIAFNLFPNVSPYYLSACVILPGLLGGAALGQTGGNLFLRLRFGMDSATRRGFATRLSLARSPDSWPVSVKRWLFTGDWLGSPAYDLRLPYVRIFVKGDAPHTCRDEDALWREIHGQISGDSLWEAGANIREISYPSELPAWAREVEKGDGYSDLEKRIGPDEANAWVMHLWRRACRQWPALGANDYPEKARRECFEMHSMPLTGGREALVVVLRPVTFVAEMTHEHREEKELAA